MDSKKIEYDILLLTSRFVLVRLARDPLHIDFYESSRATSQNLAEMPSRTLHFWPNAIGQLTPASLLLNKTEHNLRMKKEKSFYKDSSAMLGYTHTAFDDIIRQLAKVFLFRIGTCRC